MVGLLVLLKIFLDKKSNGRGMRVLVSELCNSVEGDIPEAYSHRLAVADVSASLLMFT